MIFLEAMDSRDVVNLDHIITINVARVLSTDKKKSEAYAVYAQTAKAAVCLYEQGDPELTPIRNYKEVKNVQLALNNEIDGMLRLNLSGIINMDDVLVRAQEMEVKE